MHCSLRTRVTVRLKPDTTYVRHNVRRSVRLQPDPTPRPPYGGKVPFDFAQGYSVVAGSPPLYAFITAAIPEVTNVSAASAARVRMRSTSAISSPSNLA